MSRHPEPSYPFPEHTQRVARAAFRRGNPYMQVADRLGTIYHDAQFTALFPRRGQPAETPARLALATVLQFAEGLSDRQAAEAVRSRIDWKYVLGLELTDPGFDHTVLSEFRTRLVTGEAEVLLLVLQLYLWNRTSFVVPVFGDSLVPAAPRGPGQNTLHALLCGQHKTPEEAANLADTQRHPNPRTVLKAVRLPRVEPWHIFFNGGAAGRWTARSTVNSAYAHLANVIGRYHPVQRRT